MKRRNVQSNGDALDPCAPVFVARPAKEQDSDKNEDSTSEQQHKGDAPIRAHPFTSEWEPLPQFSVPVSFLLDDSSVATLRCVSKQHAELVEDISDPVRNAFLKHDGSEEDDYGDAANRKTKFDNVFPDDSHDRSSQKYSAREGSHDELSLKELMRQEPLKTDASAPLMCYRCCSKKRMWFRNADDRHLHEVECHLTEC